MTPTLPQIATLTPEDLSRDLAILESNPTILDAFLPSHLQSATATTPPITTTAPLETYTANTTPTPEDSVALSRAFIGVARQGVLALVKDGAEGKLGALGDDVERVRAEAEQLEGSLRQT